MALSQPRGAHLAAEPDVAELAREADAESADPSSRLVEAAEQPPGRMASFWSRMVSFLAANARDCVPCKRRFRDRPHCLRASTPGM